MDIFQSQRFAASLSGLSNTTERLARIMKNDARMRKADYAEISRLNDRLNRVIPIIPAAFGIAGATLGAGVDSGVFPPFGLPGFGFPPFQLPGKPKGGGGSKKPKEPKGPKDTGPPVDVTIEEEKPELETQPQPIRLPVIEFDPTTQPQEEEQEILDSRSVEANILKQEEAKAAAEAERQRKRKTGEEERELTPAEMLEKLKERYGEQFPEIFEEGPVEVPQIVPRDKPIQQPERELPLPLRLIQGFLDIFKLNEVARQTTIYTLGQSGDQEKIREILELSLNDQKVAEKIVQAFGLSTQLIPLIKLAYNLIPVGPAKYKKLFTAVRFIANSARQGNLNPTRIKQIKADVERYVRTGSFFRGVPDAQRLESAGMIRAQGARGPAGGYTNPLTGGPVSNIFRQTEFARKIQQALGDRFPTIKPPQGMQNPYRPGNQIIPFDIKNLGTLVKTKEFNPLKYLEKVQTQGGGFFNRNPMPKKRETQLQPSDIKSQIERSGGFQDSDGNFYIFRGDRSSAPGPQSSANIMIKPIYILTDKIA